MVHRTTLLQDLNAQRRDLERSATFERYDQHRQSAIALLASPEVRRAFDVTRADEATQVRYGRTARLVAPDGLPTGQGGVNLVQVNLGNNETWDMHGGIFDG